MSPRPQIDHIRKPQILAAAAEVIAERGIAATRIADVAERAGTSGPAVLYWFDSQRRPARRGADLSTRTASTPSSRAARRGPDSPAERLRVLIAASSVGGELMLWMELWTRALRDPGCADARHAARPTAGAADRRDRRARARRPGSSAAPTRRVALELAALIDGLAVQVTLGDEFVSPERMMAIARRVAESELGAELPAAPWATPSLPRRWPHELELGARRRELLRAGAGAGARRLRPRRLHRRAPLDIAGGGRVRQAGDRRRPADLQLGPVHGPGSQEASSRRSTASRSTRSTSTTSRRW